MLRRLPEFLGGRDDFVVKPNCGSGGRGVLVIVGRDGDGYIRHNGERLRARRAAAALFGHPLRHVLAGRPAGHGHRPAARPPAPGVRGDQLQGHPRRARHPLPQRAGDGDAAAADEGVERPGQPAPGRHRHRRRSRVAASPTTPSSATASSSAIRTPACRSSACACRTGRRCWTCRAAWPGGRAGLCRRGHRRGRARKGRCCWRPTPARGWRFRSPTARGWCRVCRQIDDLLDRRRPLVLRGGFRERVPGAVEETVSSAA